MRIIRGEKDKLVNAFKSFFEKEKGKASVIGMCGGRSIIPFLEPLKEKEFSNGFRYFFIDERLVSIDDDLSNYKGLKSVFFDSLEDVEVYPFYYYEMVEPHELLKEYQESFDEEGGKFDVVILGAGEDGHIASLFPFSSVNREDNGFFYVYDSPKPPKERVSASPSQIKSASRAVLLFMGEGKKQALANFLDPSKSIEECPAKLALEIRDLLVLTDIEDESK